MSIDWTVVATCGPFAAAALLCAAAAVASHYRNRRRGVVVGSQAAGADAPFRFHPDFVALLVEKTDFEAWADLPSVIPGPAREEV